MSYKTELRKRVKAVSLEKKQKVLDYLNHTLEPKNMTVGEAAKFLELELDVFARIAGDIIEKNKKTYTLLPKTLEG